MPLSKTKNTKPKPTRKPSRSKRVDADGNSCMFPEHQSCPLNDPVGNATKPYLYQQGCRNADGCKAANSAYYRGNRAAKKAAETKAAKKTKKVPVKKSAAKAPAKKRVRRAAA